MKLPLIYMPGQGSLSDCLIGCKPAEIEKFYPRDPIRQIERASIRHWMEAHRHLLTGSVLDFGCGKSPHRDLCTGTYVGYDVQTAPAYPPFDSIICNQVVQYLSEISISIETMYEWLEPGGHLLMTYPTNWDEVESDDLWRFTKKGMELLLKKQGFTVIEHEQRAAVRIGSFSFPLGYGVVAVATR